MNMHVFPVSGGWFQTCVSNLITGIQVPGKGLKPYTGIRNSWKTDLNETIKYKES